MFTPKKNKNSGRKERKGFTLIEILLAVGILGVLGVGLYSVYKTASVSTAALNEARALAGYVSDIESVTAMSGDFSRINIEFLEEYGIMVERRNGLMDIVSPDGQTLNFMYEDLSPEFCTKFSSNILAMKGDYRLLVDGQEIDNDNSPIDAISLACNDGADMIVSVGKIVNTNTLTDESVITAYNYNQGNPLSVGSRNLNPLVSVPMVGGQTNAYVPFGDGGFGFVGIANSVVIPPIPLPPNGFVPAEDGPEEVVPEDDSTSYPQNVLISNMSLTLEVANWDLIQINAKDFKFDVKNLFSNKNYYVEVLSDIFSLESNNPVKISAEMSMADELSTSLVSDAAGSASFNSGTHIFDISPYFRASLGLDADGVPITNPNEPMNNSLKSFLEVTAKNLPVNLDVLDSETQKMVGTTSFLPIWIYPESEFLRNLKTFDLHNRSMTNNKTGYSTPTTNPDTLNRRVLMNYGDNDVSGLGKRANPTSYPVRYTWQIGQNKFTLLVENAAQWAELLTIYDVYFSSITYIGNISNRESRQYANFIFCIKGSRFAQTSGNYFGWPNFNCTSRGPV